MLKLFTPTIDMDSVVSLFKRHLPKHVALDVFPATTYGDFLSLVGEGKTIQATKLYKKITGCPLKEAILAVKFAQALNK